MVQDADMNTNEQEIGGNENEQRAPTRSCRVYVGNLSWKVRAQDLHDHMKVVGEVRKVDIFEDYNGRSKGCAIVEFAAPPEAEKAIQEMTDTQIYERPIFVREDRESGNSSGPNRRPYPERQHRPRDYENSGNYSREDRYSNRTQNSYNSQRFNNNNNSRPRPRDDDYGRMLFVSNLPYKTSWQELKDLFRKCGTVIRADVLRYPDGSSRGVGTVLFDDPASAEIAINDMHGYLHEGRQLAVRLDRC